MTRRKDDKETHKKNLLCRTKFVSSNGSCRVYTETLSTERYRETVGELRAAIGKSAWASRFPQFSIYPSRRSKHDERVTRLASIHHVRARFLFIPFSFFSLVRWSSRTTGRDYVPAWILRIGLRRWEARDSLRVSNIMELLNGHRPFPRARCIRVHLQRNEPYKRVFGLSARGYWFLYSWTIFARWTCGYCCYCCFIRIR